MKVTNNSRLPESIVRLVSGGDRVYAPNEVSVTRLIRPPQMVALESQHDGDLVEDAADRIWASYGTLMHLALEKMGHDDALVEEKLTIDVRGYKVSGTPDLFTGTTLSDFKFVSVWTTIDGVKMDWETQLNFYAHLLREHGHTVDTLQIVAMYRDWSKTRAREHGYPQQQAAILPVKMWTPEITAAVLDQHVEQYDRAMQGEYAPCTEEERWHRPNEWAVTKKGNKRANRILPTMDAAYKWAKENAPRDPEKYLDWFDVQMRPGADARCDNYCSVSAYCNQYRAQYEARAIAD